MDEGLVMKSKAHSTRFCFCLIGAFILQVFALHAQKSARDTDGSEDSIVFTCIHKSQFWKVPSGVTQIHVDAYGAQGGSERGGKGGRVQSDMTVLPKTELIIRVGGQPEDNKPGFNGGGAGCGNGTGGGGATDIRIGGADLVARVLVAGGGGGAGYGGRGGAGGGLSAGDGTYENDLPGYHIAKGGTQEAGGEGARAYRSPAGKRGFGGNGINNVGECSNNGMGGGGGGYFGGGASGAGGGGGGSSYTSAINSNVIHTQGVQEGNGKLVIYWKKK
jgi:hypothetical protein